jgi:hypothetical protein
MPSSSKKGEWYCKSLTRNGAWSRYSADGKDLLSSIREGMSENDLRISKGW